MSKNISEELPARKHAPAAAPVQAKEGGKGKSESGSVEEASAKRIRQAVTAFVATLETNTED